MHVWSSLGHRVRARAARYFGRPGLQKHHRHATRRRRRRAQRVKFQAGGVKKSEILGDPAEGGPAEGVSEAGVPSRVSGGGVRGNGVWERGVLRRGFGAGKVRWRI